MSIETQDPQQAVGDGDLGILAHVAISALHGAVRGLQAQQAARQAAAPPPAPVVVKPAAPPAAKPAPAVPRLPATRDDLARAQMYAFSVQSLKIAHSLGHPDEDPKAAQKALLEAGRSQQIAQKLVEMGIQQDGHVDTFQEARERDLGKLMARSQVILIASPDSGVDVYPVPPELQRNVAAALTVPEIDPHPASTPRVWGAPPASKMKSGKETKNGKTQQED